MRLQAPGARARSGVDMNRKLDRLTLVGNAFNATLAAAAERDLDAEAVLGARLIAELEARELAVVHTAVATEIAGEFLPPPPRRPVGTLPGAFLDVLQGARAELSVTVADAVARIMALNRSGQARPAAETLYQALDTCIDVARHVAR